MRRAAASALFVAALLGLGSGCDLQMSPRRVDAFFTSDGRVVFEPAKVPEGEVVIRIVNSSPVKHKPALIELDTRLSAVRPTADGTLPIGPYGEVGWRGEGYALVQALDTLRDFQFGQTAVKAVVHTYLRAGQYALVDALPSRFGKGWHAELTVTPR